MPLLAIGYPMGRFGDRYKSDMRCENGPFAGVSQRNLTWEPTGVVEYVIPADFRRGADAGAMAGNPAIDFVGGLERNWSNISGREYC